MRRIRIALAAATAIFGIPQTSCNQAILTAPVGSTLAISANPTFIPANGGVSVISVLVIEPAGTPVADGTVVQFFTDLGSIPEQGKTNDGVCRVNFVSDSRSGTATITAVSGGGSLPTPSTTTTLPSTTTTTTSTTQSGQMVSIDAAAGPMVAQAGGGGSSASVEVTIGNPNANSLFLTADPPRITDSRSTHITANVFDAAGNPIRSVPVFFAIVANPATEFLDNSGPVFTDNNGQASTVMRTRRSTSGTATVGALVPGGPTGTVDVAIVIPQ
jgi:hypothetical protein